MCVCVCVCVRVCVRVLVYIHYGKKSIVFFFAKTSLRHKALRGVPDRVHVNQGGAYGSFCRSSDDSVLAMDD